MPCGFNFSSVGNSGWSINGVTGYLEYTVTGLINPGASTTVPLVLTVDICDMGTQDYTNVVEISEDGDETGGPIDDFDSTPNDIPDDDPVGEDDIDDIEVDVVLGASIGDFVFNDLDGDGIQDFGEPGIPGVMVLLYDEFGNLVEATETDMNGMYLFEDVLPGDYYLVFELNDEDLQPTVPNVGNDDFDSDYR